MLGPGIHTISCAKLEDSHYGVKHKMKVSSKKRGLKRQQQQQKKYIPRNSYAQVLSKKFVGVFLKLKSQRLLEIGLQIFDILNTDGQPNQAVGNAQFFPMVFWNFCVGHCCRVTDETFNAAQTFRQRE